MAANNKNIIMSGKRVNKIVILLCLGVACLGLYVGSRLTGDQTNVKSGGETGGEATEQSTQNPMTENAADETFVQNDARIVDPLKPYDSARLCRDAEALAARYPVALHLEYIGASALGNDIPLLKLGRGSRAVLWVGGVHAREVAASAWLMLVAEDYANAYANKLQYGGVSAETAQRLLDTFTVYIVPMANPDGVDVATAGGPANVKVDDRATWKNNANGVDINRNFPFDWENAGDGAEAENLLYFKGYSAGSEPETKALMDLCESVPFEHMVSCHMSGQIIYWRDEKNGAIPGDETLARTVAAVTGYEMQPPTASAYEGWAGGFENWFRHKYGRPGLCLEFARFNTAEEAYMSRFYADDMFDWPKTGVLLYAVLEGTADSAPAADALQPDVGEPFGDGAQAAIQQPDNRPIPDTGKIYALNVRNYLSLRVSPSTAAARIKRLGVDDKVIVLGVDRDFARVRVLGETGLRGYVLWSYLLPADDQNADLPADRTGAHMVVCNDGLTVRAAPASSADSVEILKAGEFVEVNGYEGDFAQVTTQNGNAGYSLKSYLSAVEHGSDR